MKILLIGFVFIFSQALFAQPRSGGGGINFSDEPIIDKSMPVILPEPTLPAPIEIRTMYSKLTKDFLDSKDILHKQNLKCSSVVDSYIDTKDMNFYEIYISLSILRSTMIASDKCEKAHTYFKCFSTPELKEQVLKTLSDKANRKYLQEENKLKEKDLEEIKNFFMNLEKTCEKDACHM